MFSSKKLLDSILINDLPHPKKIILAYSGGMDSLLCIPLLKNIYHAKDILPVICDIGQPGDVIELALQRAKNANLSIKVEVLDLKHEFLNDWLPRAIKANAQLNGYPIAAPIIKQIIGQCLCKMAIDRGYNAIAEGSSHTGNDQYRFASAISYYGGKIKHLAPIRDLQLNRQQEIDLCSEYNLQFNKSLVAGGDDTTPWCRSIASAAIAVNEIIPTSVLRWIKFDSQNEYICKIKFNQGLPVAINDEHLGLLQILENLNEKAGLCGVGFIDVIEENTLGLKGREVYEAPAAVSILHAKKDLELLCLPREVLMAKLGWEHTWVDLVYRGEAFHPLIKALDASITIINSWLEGEITMHMKNGSIRILNRVSKRALSNDDLRLLIKSKLSFDDAAGALKLRKQKYSFLSQFSW